MLPDLLDALTRPVAYRRFAGEKAGRTAAYVAFLSLIFVGALGIAVKLRLVPLFDRTFSWLETSMPTLTFDDGVATSVPPGPQRLEHPQAKGVAIMIDTARKTPVTAKDLADAKVLAYLTSNALYLQRGGGRIETLDLSKAGAERPVTVDAASYKDLARAFDWIFYPSLFLFFFLLFALSLATFGLLYALAGLLLASAAGGSLEFSGLFRLAIHAQTAAALLRALDTSLPWAIPYSAPLGGALSLTYLWLGVRAAARVQAPGAEPPAAA